MTKGLKALVGVVLVFSLLFSGVGYATLTDSLSVTGSASAEAPDEVYVYGATAITGTFVNLDYSGPLIMADSVTFDSDGKATVSIDVFNNTAESYMFYGVNALNGVVAEITDPNKVEQGNELDPDGTKYIVAIEGDKENNISSVKGAEIASGEKHNGLLLTITGAAGATVSDLYLSVSYRQSSFHNGWVKVEGAAAKFGEILNTPVSYDKMMEEMQGYDESGRLNASYIGNVAGAQTGPDNAAINALFEDALKMDLNNDGITEDGEIVTLMIKTANLDGNTSTGITVEDGDNFLFWETPLEGCEMVLYMTPALLGTDSVSNSSYVQTYIVTYRHAGTNEDGSLIWEQVGDMLEGACQVNNYGGGNGNTSVYTDTWRPTKNYTFNGKLFEAQITWPDGFDYRLGYTQAQLGSVGNAMLSGANGLYDSMLRDHLNSTATAQTAIITDKKEYL